MNLNKRLTPLLCAWVLAALLRPMSAQEPSTPQAISLEQAKEYALTHNKTIQTSKLDVTIASKKVWETTSIGLPQASFAANYQHIFKVPEFSFGEGTPPVPIMEQDNMTFDFQVSQLIFSGEYIVGLQAAKVFKTISGQALKKNELEVMQTVESTYHTALTLTENLTIVQQNVELTKNTLAEMEAMLKSGFLEDTEVDQLRMNLTGLNNLELSMAGQLANLHNLLKFQMGMELTAPITLTDNLEGAIAGVPAIVGSEFLAADNIDYQMASNNVAIQKLNLRRQQSTFLPTISAFYQHQEKLKAPLLDFTPKDLFGVTLSLPIFTSFQRVVKVKQASLELEKSRIAQSQAEQGLELQYQSQKLAYETAYNSFLNQKTNVELSKRIFDKTTVKLKEGMASSLDLTQVQSQYLSATSNYYTAVLNLLNARSELNKLTSKQQ